MATLPAIKRITREDLQDAPSWIDRLLFPLNVFLDSMYRALNGNVTFVDNITAQKYSFELTAGVSATNNTFKFSPTLKKVPEFVIWKVIPKDTNYTPIASAVWFDWYYDGSYINISSITGLTSGKTYSITLLII